MGLQSQTRLSNSVCMHTGSYIVLGDLALTTEQPLQSLFFLEDLSSLIFHYALLLLLLRIFCWILKIIMVLVSTTTTTYILYFQLTDLYAFYWSILLALSSGNLFSFNYSWKHEGQESSSHLPIVTKFIIGGKKILSQVWNPKAIVLNSDIYLTVFIYFPNFYVSLLKKSH